MYQTRLLKVALVALTALEAAQAWTTSQADIDAYPSVSKEMANCGGYQWEAHSLTGLTGYNLSLFRIVGDDLGASISAPKGPVLLTGGLFSGATDFMKCESGSSVAVQLA